MKRPALKMMIISKVVKSDPKLISFLYFPRFIYKSLIHPVKGLKLPNDILQKKGWAYKVDIFLQIVHSRMIAKYRAENVTLFD